MDLSELFYMLLLSLKNDKSRIVFSEENNKNYTDNRSLLVLNC